MTREEFDQIKWGVGMRIKHTYSLPSSKSKVIEDEYAVTSVNFAENTIGVRDGSYEECPNCGESIEILSWLNYENCEIIEKGEDKCEK